MALGLGLAAFPNRVIIALICLGLQRDAELFGEG